MQDSGKDPAAKNAMRIAILNLTAGGMSGGYMKYLINILPRMAANPDVAAILCVTPWSLRAYDWLGQLCNVEFRHCRPFRPWRRNDSELRKHVEKFDPDVIFIPMERHFEFGNVPVVNMVQNMLPMVSIPNNITSERVRNEVQRRIARNAIKQSDRVIAVSNFVKEFLCREWSVPSSKIELVYHGVDMARNTGSTRPNAVPKEWKNRFLFTAGSIDPFRGLEDLLFAVGNLALRGEEVRVVIAGNARMVMQRYLKKLQGLARGLGVASNIIWAGTLTEAEMSWCYWNCSTFVMTSRVEACPNIALEAMAYGCLSICANNPPLPEFFGDSAIFYTPSEKDSLAEAIREAARLDGERRKSLSERAMERAAAFSWDKTVESTLLGLAKAVNGSN